MSSGHHAEHAHCRTIATTPSQLSKMTGEESKKISYDYMAYGLETIAKWDPINKEFELHSPYLTASKWWNGGMGRTATHAVGLP